MQKGNFICGKAFFHPVNKPLFHSYVFLFPANVEIPGNTMKGAPFRKASAMDDFEQLAEQFNSMIFSIIHTLHIYKNKDEFYQIGLLALWDASKNFDEKKGAQFSTYAYHYIKGRIMTSLRKESKREERILYPSEEFWGLIEYEMRVLEKENLLDYFYQLTQNQEKWVIAHFYNGLKDREIAERENVSISSVKQWRKLAMKKLVQLKE